jgi:cytochrome c peroxidase
MFAFLGISQKQKCATCHSSTSIAKYHSFQKQHGAFASKQSGTNLPGNNLLQTTHLGYNNKCKTRQGPITSGNLEFKTAGTIPVLEPPTERILPKIAKLCWLPKYLRNTVILAT